MKYFILLKMHSSIYIINSLLAATVTVGAFE